MTWDSPADNTQISPKHRCSALRKFQAKADFARMLTVFRQFSDIEELFDLLPGFENCALLGKVLDTDSDLVARNIFSAPTREAKREPSPDGGRAKCHARRPRVEVFSPVPAASHPSRPRTVVVR